MFAAAPLAISDSLNATPQSMGAGAGFGFTSLDAGDSFGVMVNGAVYHHLLSESIPFHIVDSGPLPQGVSPIGIDFALGCTVPLINTPRVSFPLTMAFHTRAALLEKTVQMDIGAVGQAGFTFWGKRTAFFIRANVYLDFSRILFDYGNFGLTQSAALSALGVMPEIGITIHLGKSGTN